jgi:glycosyltransferase involved in cell wall biosynthesis
LISVVVTVRNEGPRLGALLDSLLVQQSPWEVVIVDSESEDDTLAVAQQYAQRHPSIRVFEHPGTRGEGRNFGVAQARGASVAFIDGDCVAGPGWLAGLRSQLQRTSIAAGVTQQVGYAPWESLARVELEHRGFDVTHPSCNLAYEKEVFDRLGGFDPWFHTAEDIDLNYRAVDAGHEIVEVREAVVFHKTRSTVRKFLQQAFWNGYGRKQLTLKHGRLWSRYSLRQMFRTQLNTWALLRLGAALVGYLMAYIREVSHDRGDAEGEDAGVPRTSPPDNSRGASARRP